MAPSRRVMHSTHPWLRIRAASWRSTPPDASSNQWASSTMTSTGPARSRIRSAETVRSTRCRRTASPSSAVSRVGESSRPRTTPISGSHGRQLRRHRRRRGGQPPSVSSTSASARSSASNSSSRSRSTASTPHMPLAELQDPEVGGMPIASATRRDFPTPGRRQRRRRPRRHDARGQQALDGGHLGLAPISGPCSAACARRLLRRSTGPTIDASTGCDFPFTADVSSGIRAEPGASALENGRRCQACPEQRDP